MRDPSPVGADPVERVVSRVWPDASEADKAKVVQVLTLLNEPSGVDQTEVAKRSLFVSGWRPAIGWVCVAALAYTYIGYPLLLWLAAIFAPEIKPPVLPSDVMLFELILGVLGLGGLRTFEKIKGIVK